MLPNWGMQYPRKQIKMARGNSGKIIRLDDGRLVIVYNNQPLLKESGKIVMHLIGDDYKALLGEDKKQKTILKDLSDYNLQCKNWQLIGFVD